MTLTDDELRELKGRIAKNHFSVGYRIVALLIARLEAAEKCCEAGTIAISGCGIECESDDRPFREAYEVWRKAAGK